MHLLRPPRSPRSSLPVHVTRVIAATLLISACSSSSGPGSSARSLGLLITSISSVPTIVIPRPIQAGVPVTIIVNSFGSSSCLKPDGMDVQHTTAGVTLTPWDRVSTSGACTDDLAPHPHEARVTFATSGSVQLTVRGLLLDAQGRRKLGTVDTEIIVE